MLLSEALQGQEAPLPSLFRRKTPVPVDSRSPKPRPIDFEAIKELLNFHRLQAGTGQ